MGKNNKKDKNSKKKMGDDKNPAFKKPKRHKSDYFCAEKIEVINYQDIHHLRKFISERGKINKRGSTKLTARNQRKLAKAVKRARVIGLVPFQVD